MRLFPHSDSGSDLEAEDARRKWINVYDGFDKARDKVNPHVKPESTFLIIVSKYGLEMRFSGLDWD